MKILVVLLFLSNFLCTNLLASDTTFQSKGYSWEQAGFFYSTWNTSPLDGSYVETITGLGFDLPDKPLLSQNQLDDPGIALFARAEQEARLRSVSFELDKRSGNDFDLSLKLADQKSNLACPTSKSWTKATLSLSGSSSGEPTSTSARMHNVGLKNDCLHDAWITAVITPLDYQRRDHLIVVIALELATPAGLERDWLVKALSLPL